MKIAVYKRVSTNAQDVAAQAHAVQQWLDKHPGAEVFYFEDQGLSGKDTKNRPGLQALLAAVQSKQVDTVVVYRLDRLSRKAVDAMRMLLDWLQQGIAFIAVDQPALHLGAENPMRLTVCAMFADFAELERQAIVSRVKSGLAAAKARGVKLGKPRKYSEATRGKIRELTGTMTVRAIAKQLNVPPTTVSRVAREA